MTEFYVKPGDNVTFAKTVGETDIYLFAGITGDFSVNHVNEQYMSRSKYGHRIAHGALLIGFMSTCSTHDDREMPRHRPATRRRSRSATTRCASSARCYIGDTVTLTYTITEVDPVKRRSGAARSRSINQKGELVGVARHILAWVKDSD